MRRIILIATVLAFSLLSANSCILDPENKKDPGPPPEDRFKDLSKRDHVLINLEEAYNQRKFDKYNELLDEGFTFWFSRADLDSQFVDDESWGRVREARSAAHMFDPTYAPPNRSPITRIDLTLAYAVGEDRWAREVGTPDKHPGEDWFEKTVTYNMTIEAGIDQFLSTNIKASFLVRYAEIAPGDSIWRVVTWRDDI